MKYIVIVISLLFILTAAIKLTLPLLVFPIRFLPPRQPASNQQILNTSQGKIAIIQSGRHFNSAGRPQVVFCHGNGHTLDLSLQRSMEEMATTFRMMITSMDYPGYGLSEGTASERSVNKCISDVIRQLPTKNPVVMIGKSVGSGPCVEWARHHYVRATILISPFKSIIRTKLPFSIPGLDMFDNSSAIKHVYCPVLIVHGKNDEIVPYDHGVELAHSCRDATFVSKECGHNDIDWLPDAAEFLDRLV